MRVDVDAYSRCIPVKLTAKFTIKKNSKNFLSNSKMSREIWLLTRSQKICNINIFKIVSIYEVEESLYLLHYLERTSSSGDDGETTHTHVHVGSCELSSQN